MCGITGLHHPSGAPYEPPRQAIERMTSTLTHRGPDDEGYYLDDFTALGHRRLSIIDLQTGRQPISNESGDVWIVFNGEICNHGNLRRVLEGTGHTVRTRSDTEAIVHAYEEWDTAIYEHPVRDGNTREPRRSSRTTDLVTPLKPLEAMAMATPIVARDVGGLRELVRVDETGLLCPPSNPDRLAEVLIAIGSDEALRARLGANARRVVAEEHDWTRVVAVYQDAYRRLLGSSVGNGTAPLPTRSATA